jgi:hypothetical protein
MGCCSSRGYFQFGKKEIEPEILNMAKNAVLDNIYLSY